MTHEEIEAYGYGNEIIFKNLEEKIMADIVRKIKTAGDLSGSTVYLMEQLSYMGYDIDSIKKMIQEALEESEEYVDKLYDDVLQHEYLGASPIFQAKEMPMIPFKQNPVMQNLLSFAKSSTNGEMKNMTQSLGFVKKTIDGTKAVELTKFYQETMDKALMEVATGTFSLNRALNDAVNVMVNSGVRWIDYESGHHIRIAVAARRSVMSGLANASQEQTKNMAKELDIHTFEVSAHMGARPTHAVWQGKVYTDEELVSVCGLGEVTGLLGANCYHNYYMFFEGVSKRTYTDEELERWKDDTPTKYEGKEYTNYEARQRMRQMETNMRAQKEKIKLLEKGGASKEVIQSAQARYRKQMSEYERFADAMNMKTQKNRITIGDGKTMKGVDMSEKMASNKNSIWPRKGNLITDEERRTLTEMIKSYGFNPVNIKAFDGDSETVQKLLESTKLVLEDFPELLSRPHWSDLVFTYDMDDEDFAETKISSRRMHINGKVLRSKDTLEKEHRSLVNEGWFVNGTDYSAILVHELGHQLHTYYHIDTVEIAMKVSKSISREDLMDYLKNNVSLYSAVDVKKGSEILSEVFTDYYCNENTSEFSLNFMAEVVKIILEKRG